MKEQSEGKHVVELRPKPSRHIVIAKNHLNKRREVLIAKRVELTREIEEIDAALLALE